MLSGDGSVTYAQLDAQQRRIVDEKRVTLTLGARALRDLLVPLARFDAAGDRARARVRRWLLRGLAGTFIGGFVLIMSGLSPFVAPLPASAALLAIGAGLRYRRLGRLDLSNNLRGLVVPLLTVLGEEAGAESPMTLDLDLRPAIVPDKLVRTDPARADGRYHAVVDRWYRDPWMTGQAELAEGVQLAWSIVDDVLEQRKSRRNPRGKTKTKTKLKKRCTMTVTVSLPEGAYAVADEPEGAGGGGETVRLKAGEGDRRQTFKISRVVKVGSLEPPDAGDLLDLVAAAYRRAIPVTEPVRR